MVTLDTVCFDLDGEQRIHFLRYIAHHMRDHIATKGAVVFSLVATDPCEKADLTRSIGLGCHTWNHGGQIFNVDMHEEGQPCGDVPSFFTRLRVSGTDGVALQSFLNLALNFKPPPCVGHVRAYAASRHGYWRDARQIPAQSFSDLFLPEKDVSGLIEHVDRFLESEELYLRTGRVQKLCLLFVGIPGSGKSSLVRALALKYSRAIYSMSLSDVSDSVCNELISSIPSAGILLIEDFDSLGFSISSNRRKDEDRGGGGLSRSGFLNVLDGNGSPPKGTIICLTGTVALASIRRW
jgi:hypothetical protein